MSNLVEVKVPDIGDFKDIPVIEVLVNAGDAVDKEDSLITLESDKATMDVPSPAAGVVKELKVKVGDKVSEGAPVLILEAAAGSPASQTQGEVRAAPAPRSSQPAPSTSAPQDGAASPRPEREEKREGRAPASRAEAGPGEKGRESRGQSTPRAAEARDEGALGRAHASPAVRRVARELGVDLSRVKGSGPKERILKEDVRGYVKAELARPRAADIGVGSGLPPQPQVDFAKFGPVETQSLPRIKKLSGGHLHRNWLTIPHVTQHDESDITDLEAFRRAQAEEAKRGGIKFTLLAFLMKAVIVALKEHPEFNASLAPDGENLILKRYYHIGVAVDTPNGLVVPVIREVDKKGLLELAKELGEASERMRAGKIAPTDLQGGCFSISSLGGIGGTAFTPIINAPEVAILGVGKAVMKPVWNGKEFAPRLMLPLSLSYDHRVIDGAQGARFISYLGGVLSDIRRLVL
jgi:pyruvate dehydrogenase E2 component (dihydrolipoamide acetyltransferase)